MFNNPFLEEPSANRNRRQQLDHLLRITAPHERVILVCIGLVLLILVVWSLFGSIARSVSIEGVLIEPGDRHEVTSIDPGHLVQFLVAPGDRVEVGDPVARQSVPELEREAAALRDRIALLETGIQRSGGDASALNSLLASAEVALLQMKARHSARELIVSHVSGEVMALQSDPGEYLPVGSAVALLRNAEDKPLQAVLRVDPNMAQRLQPGMRALIEFATSVSATQQLHGEVASVTTEPLPNWLATLHPAVADSMHRVDIVLHEASDLSVPDGTPCHVRIMLGRYPLTALIDPKGY